jgi:hypothetical protein
MSHLLSDMLSQSTHSFAGSEMKIKIYIIIIIILIYNIETD